MKKMIVITTGLAVFISMASMAQATLTTIGTATYMGSDYKLIWDDDNNGNSVVWLDYSHPKTQWTNQNAWPEGLDSVLTYNIDAAYSVSWDTDWRLGSAGLNPQIGYNQTTSEVGHLFYEELGLDSRSVGSSTTDAELNAGNFDNLIPSLYWYSTEAAGNSSLAWFFSMSYGSQDDAYKTLNAYGLAVRSGQVTLSPINKCLYQGDFDCDGDVDSSDLNQFSNLYGNIYPNQENLYPASVPKTGQTTIYETGDDGDIRAGVASPEPRFTYNGDGTVTDNLTGLIWLKNANCFGTRNWTTAINDALTLNDGECDLSDGSMEGDWRLPSNKELYSLVNSQYSIPALSNSTNTGQWTEDDAFSGVQPDYYWSSTTDAGTTDWAWHVHFTVGHVGASSKINNVYVWPVRGGQIENGN